MRREKYVLTIWIAVLTVWLAGCGSSSSSNTPNPVSGLKKRVLITNSQNGVVQLLDALNDKFNKTLGTTTPTRIVTSGGISVVINGGVPSISMIDNTKEAVSAVGTLLNPASDVAISPDGKTAYAAVQGSGSVEIFNTADGTLVTFLSVPSASRLVMGPKGNKVLAFPDDPQSLVSNANSFFVIDTASKTVAPVLGLPVGNQPFSAVFDPSDPNDTTAFILNCGTECAGSAAPSVAKVNFATPATPTVNVVTRPGLPPAITGATVGLLSGSNLFVAGTTSSPAGCTLTACGSVQVINTGTLVAGDPIPITDGLHTQMALTSNNHLYIGASSCTPGVVVSNQVRGCLTIFNTGAAVSGTNPAFPAESSFRSDLNVTGLQPISSRSVIYVIQGGELDIFDFTTDSLTANQLDVVGHAVGVVQIDP